MWFHELAQRFHVLADGEGGAGEHLEFAERRVAAGPAGRECVAPDVVRAFGQEEDRLPALGDLRGQLHVLRAEGGQQHRNAFAHRMIDQLQRFAEAGAALGGQRHPVVLALELQALAAPHPAADLDDLAGAADRRVVGHAVEALDHLRAGGPEAEDEAAVGDVVQAGRRHRGQRGGPRVQLQDARGQLHVIGPGGEIAERAHRVERVRLGHEDDVQSGPFQVGDLGGHFLETARIVDAQSDTHESTIPTLRRSSGATPAYSR